MAKNQMSMADRQRGTEGEKGSKAERNIQMEKQMKGSPQQLNTRVCAYRHTYVHICKERRHAAGSHCMSAICIPCNH